MLGERHSGRGAEPTGSDGISVPSLWAIGRIVTAHSTGPYISEATGSSHGALPGQVPRRPAPLRRASQAQPAGPAVCAAGGHPAAPAAQDAVSWQPPLPPLPAAACRLPPLATGSCTQHPAHQPSHCFPSLPLQPALWHDLPHGAAAGRQQPRPVPSGAGSDPQPHAVAGAAALAGRRLPHHPDDDCAAVCSEGPNHPPAGSGHRHAGRVP